MLPFIGIFEQAGRLKMKNGCYTLWLEILYICNFDDVNAHGFLGQSAFKCWGGGGGEAVLNGDK